MRSDARSTRQEERAVQIINRGKPVIEADREVWAGEEGHSNNINLGRTQEREREQDTVGGPKRGKGTKGKATPRLLSLLPTSKS